MATITVTEANFQDEVIASKIPVLLDFWAEWCGPCKAMAPDLEAVSEQFAGQAKVVKIDADEFPGLASRYNVRGLPTLVVIKGGEVVDQRNGAQPRSKMIQLVQSAI